MRLAYSIAIQVDFDILLLDEVLAVGDESFQQRCFDTFRDFRAQGKTIVLVTHDLNTVQEFADRVLLLRAATAEAIGDPADVISQYRGEGVHSFLT
jgi:ABC-2 type transport system ATP-binding protein